MNATKQSASMTPRPIFAGQSDSKKLAKLRKGKKGQGEIYTCSFDPEPQSRQMAMAEIEHFEGMIARHKAIMPNLSQNDLMQAGEYSTMEWENALLGRKIHYLKEKWLL